MQFQGTWSFIFMALRPVRGYVVGSMFIAALWAFLINYQAYLVKLILNAAMSVDQTDFASRLTYLIGLYLLSEFVYIAMFRVYDWIIIYFRPLVKRYIGLLLMDNLMMHAHSFYQRQFAGSLTTRINDIITGVPDVARILIDRLLACFLLLIFVLYNMWLVNIKFALILGSWIFLFLGVSLLMIFRKQHLAYDVATARAVVTGHIVDILTNMPSIRFFASRKFEHNYLKKNIDISVQKEQDRDWFFFILHAIQGVSFYLFQLVCFVWLYNGLITKAITPGDFVLILSLNLHIIENFWNISKDMRELWEKIGNIEQGLAIIQAPIDIKDKADAHPLKITAGEIVFKNVEFTYAGTHALFQHKSVIIKPGEKVGLVGYSGSGKSTFVNLILRVFDVTAGSITIDGQDIRDVTQDSLYKSIAMIPQDPSLFHRSIFENILYGRPDATYEEVVAAAEAAYAHNFIINQSQGYDTQVGERGAKLSGGQRQRIVIARAVLKNAPILILDEATSQLDSVTETEIQDSLWNLMQNKTTLVIAHRLSTLVRMDRILVFDKGAIVEEGSHEELLAKSGLYKELWQAQVEGLLIDESNTVIDEGEDSE